MTPSAKPAAKIVLVKELLFRNYELFNKNQ